MEEYLSQHHIFKDFSLDEIKQIASISELLKYKKHSFIYSEKQPSKRFFILKKGKVRLQFSSEKNLIMAKGQIFGDWAMLNDTVRLATCQAVLDSECIAVDYSRLLNSEVFPPAIALKLVLLLTKPIISNLQTSSHVSSEILISGGENDQVEFKQTLRLNINTDKNDSKIEFAALKAIAGFLNADGGVLFIGVEDDKTIFGIEGDKFLNEDKALLHLGNLINGKLGKEAVMNVHITVVHLKGKMILRVDCAASAKPIYLTENNVQYFFVRQGAMTFSYKLEETVNYIQSNF
jgi:CRP-like cAMP-binding protein